MPRTLTSVQQVALATAQRLLDTDPRYQRGAFLKPSYVMAHCQIESNWNTSVHSSDGLGSIGLMQVLPAVAEGVGMGDQDQSDPVVSVETGMRVLAQDQAYLKHMLGHAPSLRQLVMSYNEGAGSVARGREDTHYWDAWYAAQQQWAFVDGSPAVSAPPVPTENAPTVEGEPGQSGEAPPVAEADTTNTPRTESAPAQTDASSSGDGADTAETLNAQEAASLEPAPSAGAPAVTEQQTTSPADAGVADAPVLSPGDPGYEGGQQ